MLSKCNQIINYAPTRYLIHALSIMEFNTLFTGKNFIELQHVDSTNNYAANLLNETNVPDGTVILAHFQEKGRGQTGNSWHSMAGLNIMTSIIYDMGNMDATNSFLLSKAISLGIYEAIKSFISSKIEIKWPNDIYVDDQKIAGLLIENKWQGNKCISIVGIGLNVNQKEFETLDATSVCLHTNQPMAVSDVLNTMLSKIEKYILKFKQGKGVEIAKSYLDHLRFIGEEQTFLTRENETFKGQIVEVENSGHLVVEMQDSVRRKFLFKEVFVV